MEERSYIERRNSIRRARRTPLKKRQSYFMLRLNTALALGIIVLCANMIDLDVTNAFSDAIKHIITQSSDIGAAKESVAAAVDSLLNGGGISVFAKEKHGVELSDELISQMNEQAAAYENTQKKTAER
ncbi:MAG: hypothetical protein J6A07_06260 [Firmicutes bacterium]|nr:hypothetical protein [Bacillota bacterium]